MKRYYLTISKITQQMVCAGGPTSKAVSVYIANKHAYIQKHNLMHDMTHCVCPICMHLVTGLNKPHLVYTQNAFQEPQQSTLCQRCKT